MKTTRGIISSTLVNNFPLPYSPSSILGLYVGSPPPPPSRFNVLD